MSSFPVLLYKLIYQFYQSQNEKVVIVLYFLLRSL